MTIGLTENPRKGWTPDSYVRWVRRIVAGAEIVLLSSREENYKSLERCNGLISKNIVERFVGAIETKRD